MRPSDLDSKNSLWLLKKKNEWGWGGAGVEAERASGLFCNSPGKKKGWARTRRCKHSAHTQTIHSFLLYITSLK